jgi:hypothetical protein
MKPIMIIALFFLLDSCKVEFKPQHYLDEYNFVIFPHIIKKGDIYYLHYQLKSTKKNGAPTLLTGVGHKIIGTKAYYYFSVVTSVSDSGKIIEKSLENDGFIEYAKKKSIYWLNPDGSEVKLQIED